MRKKVGTDGTGELRKGKRCHETGSLGTDMVTNVRQTHGENLRGGTIGRAVERGRRGLHGPKMTKWKHSQGSDDRVLVDTTVMVQQLRVNESWTHSDIRVAQKAARLLHSPAPQTPSIGSQNEEGVHGLQNMPLMIYSMIQHPNRDALLLQIQQLKQEKRNGAGRLKKLRSNREDRAKTASEGHHL